MSERLPDCYLRQTHRVVHESLHTAQRHRVDVGLSRVPVQPGQEAQQAIQTLRLHEPRHEAVRLSPQGDLEAVETPAPLEQLVTAAGKLQLTRGG